MRWVPRLGVWAWSFVGFVVAMSIVVTALGAINEIVLPLTFAAVLAVIFKPTVGVLQRHGFKPTLAAPGLAAPRWHAPRARTRAGARCRATPRRT